ncbi:hypothetical protein Fmac_006460 [Flemingia macrophylla]|uniref:C2H2-type domain-containing protein n=1 Tax=Flemingia macrophylla TaxID=520843 RepID=A0ABD1NAQ6_9FABA
MEFWGVEVKSGESLKVNPGDDKIVHLSNACLGDVTKDKGGEPVALYVKFGNQKLVLGTLSSDKFPQISYDLIFEKEFELSHNWKNGSVFFTGFKAESHLESYPFQYYFDEDIPVSAANGKPVFEVKNGLKSDANEAKQKEKKTDPRKNETVKEKDASDEDEDSSDSESDSGEDSSEDKPTTNGDIESSEGDDDSDDDEEDDDESDEEKTPKKNEASNKRVIDSSKKTPVPVKKAKFVTPQKTDGKNVVHVATPHPSKQAGKATANNKQTTKSGGEYSCKSCNRSFKSDDALNSHNKAKHSAK